MFDELADKIHTWSRGKGFWIREFVESQGGEQIRNPSLAAEKLMLIVSEVGEVLEGLRDGDVINEAEELADVVIRCMDYASWRGISLDHEVAAKMDKNEGRPYLHGRNF